MTKEYLAKKALMNASCPQNGMEKMLVLTDIVFLEAIQYSHRDSRVRDEPCV